MPTGISLPKVDSSKKLFFPSGGRFSSGQWYANDGSIGNYWKSSLASSHTYEAFMLYFGPNGIYWSYEYPRNVSLLIRAVLDE